MVKKFIYFGLIAAVLCSCSYSVYSNAYPHLKKVAIRPFENRSTEFEIGDIIYNELVKQFQEDGRLKLVTQQPDCVIEGTILKWEEDVYSYDSWNNVQDYMLRLTCSVVFTDLINNQIIYENKNLVLTEPYAVSSASTAKCRSKEEAIDELVSQLFKNIVQNSLETW
ncbi:MAG TPA: LptE family protein [Candidatus Syntrophosphaera sp.]|nr:LptE family protein [Candidatus Syntrophosphaera sp.]